VTVLDAGVTVLAAGVTVLATGVTVFLSEDSAGYGTVVTLV